jgi:4,5-DOPA dioxygenase extradiol
MTGLKHFMEAANGLPFADSVMPALFLGHGSPMNIIADNDFTRRLKALGGELPVPKAILVISAHWLTRGTFVSAADHPATIHDFYGFPDELYKVEYPAPGTPGGAKLTAELLTRYAAELDAKRGLDHGAYSLLVHMYPKAQIPVYQMSVDRAMPLEDLIQVGKSLQSLREKGILVIGSGNIVHNLKAMSQEEDAPVPEWAEEFDARVMNMLDRGDALALAKYQDWGKVALMAHPSNDHYLPLLYTTGLRKESESPLYLHEGFAHGTISMRCLQFG